ncbi:hypothetical protein GYH30_037212 [Glycine max]|uniref:Uncharacterized protein n=2 Tax=Glycine subgen. Soja TaxID=1462606 RepID=A0A0R0H0Y0_SOYBN|nr:hypothetical protein GYH30_037212 [Glycine max]
MYEKRHLDHSVFQSRKYSFLYSPKLQMDKRGWIGAIYISHIKYCFSNSPKLSYLWIDVIGLVHAYG